MYWPYGSFQSSRESTEGASPGRGYGRADSPAHLNGENDRRRSAGSIVCDPQPRPRPRPRPRPLDVSIEDEKLPLTCYRCQQIWCSPHCLN